MKFAVITHAKHKLKGKDIYAYEPYVREMNLWLKYVDEVQIVAPVSKETVTSIESMYQVQHGAKRHCELSEAISLEEQIATSETPRNDGLIKLTNIPAFDITSIKNLTQAIFKIPIILFRIYQAMRWADHIHLRCPGNIGLLGCFVQVLFPKKPKTVKYAGNWDPKSKQPYSYKLQKWLVSNTFLTRNCKVLVYGEWPKQSKNILPFFTASYSETEIFERHSEPSEAIFSKEQIATSQTPRNDETQRHYQLDWGSHDVEHSDEMLKQVQHDESERHPQLSRRVEESRLNSLGQAQTDNREKQIATSQTPHNDETQRHPQLDRGSHDLDDDKQITDQVGNDGILKFIYVGGLTPGKQPLLTVQTIHELKKKGYKVQLNIYGDGVEKQHLKDYISNNCLENEVKLHGNTSKEKVKKAYKKAHFLLFISKSEGWPKVVAEAMFWGCLPISSNVSCISYMLGNGSRGAIVESDVEEIVSVIEDYLEHNEKYIKHVKDAMKWSRQYTLEKFEKEIGKLL